MNGSDAVLHTGPIGSPVVAETGSNLGIVLFVVLSFAWSWSFGFVASRIPTSSPALGAFVMIVAGFGPSLAGVAVVAVSTGRSGLRRWIGRCFNWRVGRGWYVLAFLAPPVVMVFALALNAALGRSLPAFPAASQIPLVLANFGLVLVIGGPLGEEFGWRGYLMPTLTTRMTWRVASLGIGAIWGLWHLPLFSIDGTTQAHMLIAVFLINIIAGSVLFGWLFERTGGSVLPALVLHTSLNGFAGILGIVPKAATALPFMLVTGLLVFIAAVLLILPDRTQIRGQARDKSQPPC